MVALINYSILHLKMKVDYVWLSTCLSSFLINVSIAPVGPFYPGEAKRRGVPLEYVGFVFR